MQNGPGSMITRSVPLQHINARPPGQHNVHPSMGGPRMQTPGIMQMPVGQGMAGATPYNAYANPNGGPQSVQVGKLTKQS